MDTFNNNVEITPMTITTEMTRVLGEASRLKAKVQAAQVKTAQNTEDMKSQLDIVIRNQNEYIDVLKSQNQHIVHVLENLFASSEDTIIVQKEILKIMSDKGINEDLIKDKGLDVFVQGLFTCINILLAKYGINL